MSDLKGKLTAGQTMKGTASAAPYIPERMAHKLTFTGAVDAAYDGSSDVVVNIPEKMEETDPTVPAWAKNPTKPSYTAQEVGALPNDTEIPVVPSKVSAFENDAGYLTSDALADVGGKAYVQNTKPDMEVGEFWYNPDEELPSSGGGNVPDKLPNPHKLTFTGAVNAEYDGSEAVEVVIPQGYTKAEIDAIMGSYITDIDNLVGGGS